MSERLERAKAVWTRPAISIQASGRDEPHQAGHTEAPEPVALNLSENLLHRRGVHTRTFRSAKSVGEELRDHRVCLSRLRHSRVVEEGMAPPFPSMHAGVHAGSHQAAVQADSAAQCEVAGSDDD